MLPVAKINWLMDVMQSDIPPSSLQVAVALAYRQNHKTGRLDPSEKTLIIDTGLSIRSVKYAVQSLIKSGHIIRVTGGAGRGKTSNYSLVERCSTGNTFDPKKVQDPAPLPTAKKVQVVAPIEPEKVQAVAPIATLKGASACIEKVQISVQNQPDTYLDEQVKRTCEAPPAKNAKTEQKKKQNKIGAEIIDYLNLKTGHTYRPVESNLKLIRARLSEGHDAIQIMAVIDHKTIQWANNTRMAHFLRPATLFNSEKFNNYAGQLGKPAVAEYSDKNEERNAANDRAVEEFLNGSNDNAFGKGDFIDADWERF